MGGGILRLLAFASLNACILPCPCSPAARLPARDAPFLRDLPPHLAALYPGAQQPVPAAAAAPAHPARASVSPRLAQAPAHRQRAQGAAEPQAALAAAGAHRVGGGAPLNAAAAQLRALEQERRARRQQAQQAQQAQQRLHVAGMAGGGAALHPHAAPAAARLGSLGRGQQQVGAAVALLAAQIVDLTGGDDVQPSAPVAASPAARPAAGGGSRKRAAGVGAHSRVTKRQQQHSQQGGMAATEVISLLSDDSDSE